MACKPSITLNDGKEVCVFSLSVRDCIRVRWLHMQEVEMQSRHQIIGLPDVGSRCLGQANYA